MPTKPKDVITSNPTLTIRQMLEAERKKRVEACGAEIQAALAKYRCQLAAVPVLTPDGRVAANVILQAVDDE